LKTYESLAALHLKAATNTATQSQDTTVMLKN
jgi:hypothetical protein